MSVFRVIVLTMTTYYLGNTNSNFCQEGSFSKCYKEDDIACCVHVAHPLLQVPQDIKDYHPTGGKLIISRNVFVENLHKTRDLEEKFDVRDNKQMMEFYWVRESGLQIHLGVHDIHLIQQYDDVTYDSENRYILNNQQVNPYTKEDLGKFREILRNYCRHPIPEYYTVTAENHKDRTTLAKLFKCDSSNSRLPDCPLGYNNGDEYLYRSLNEACQKMGTYPEPLLPIQNSIICTKSSNLLENLFNRSQRKEQPISFPSKKCRVSKAKCQECLIRSICNTTDMLQEQCCQIDCYTQPDCKTSYSEECINVPVECAMGDAYRFTLQPNFQTNFNEFQCHLRHHSPSILYKVFYHIKIPGPYGISSDIETPRVYKDIPFSNQSLGRYKAAYISLEHGSGIHNSDDVILVGQYGENHDVNFTLHGMKSADDYFNGDIQVDEIATNVHVATTQVAPPFAYNNWGDSCEKDTAEFKPIQTHYKDTGQNVDVTVLSTIPQFQYSIKGRDETAFIRLKLPGSTSVLSHYFEKDNLGLLTPSQIYVNLQQTGATWEIQISGSVAACPSFIQLTINDLREKFEVSRYDLFIFCPPIFNMTLKIPKVKSEQESSFEIILQDSFKTYKYYLTTFLIKWVNSKHPIGINNTTQQQYTFNWKPLVAIFSVGLTLFIILHVIILFIEFTKMEVLKHRNCQDNTESWENGERYYEKKAYISASRGSASLNARSTRTDVQCGFIALYIILKVAYSFLITFTFTLALISLLLHNDFDTLSKFPAFQRKVHNKTTITADSIDQYAVDELFRQDQQVLAMNYACSRYLSERFESVLHSIIGVMDARHNSSKTYMTKYINESFSYKVSQYKKKTKDYTASLQNNFTHFIDPVIKNYERYLVKVYKNKWLQYPQSLFNKSDYVKQTLKAFRSVYLSGEQMHFSSFLPVEEVEHVQLWALNWWEKYQISLPDMPKLPPLLFYIHTNLCDVSFARNFIVKSNYSKLDMIITKFKHANSFRFFSADPNDDIFNQDTALKHDVSSTFGIESYHILDIFNEYKDKINTTALWIFLLALDVIMIVHRLNHIAFNSSELYYGFEEYIFVGESKETSHCNRESSYSVNHNCANHKEYFHNNISKVDMVKQNLNEKIEFLAALPEINSSKYCVKKDSYFSKSALSHKAIQGCKVEVCNLGTALDYIQSPTVPKVVIGLVIVVHVILVKEFIAVVFSTEIFYDFEGFKMFVVGLDLQVNKTNFHLDQQARLYNDFTLSFFMKQMNSDLIQFQQLLQYFSKEQDRLLSVYHRESCAMERHLHNDNHCDITTSTSRFNITMMPCNHIPVQPQFYHDINMDQTGTELMSEYRIFLSSLWNIANTVSYIIVIILLMTLLIHLTGVVVFRYMRSHYKFHVSQIYVTTSHSVVMAALPLPVSPSNQTTDDEDHENNATGDLDKLSVDILKSCSNVSNEDDSDFDDFIETKV